MKKCTLLLGILLLCSVVFSQKITPPKADPTLVITCTDFHITKPLSELSKEFPFVEPKQDKWERIRESADRKNRVPQKFVHSAEENQELYGNDPASIQDKMGGVSNNNKAPIKNWPGQGAAGFRPTDPSGAAGPNHYIQAINGTPFRVFNKTTGANMLTANIGTLWASPTPNDGDPIVMYDKYADRWFISQFGQTGNRIYIAISQTPDPLGAYYTYTFTSPQFPDYLKFGIWADGYYMTSNQGTDRVFCFERSQMLVGNPSARAVSQTFVTGATSAFFVPLPADADAGLPAAGTPCPFFSYSDNAWGGGAIDGVKIWNMAVTWGATPAATITALPAIPTAGFDASYDAGWNDISQPGTSQKLDGIGGVATYRAQWRQWAGYNTVLLNWGVKISATQRSIKWVELRQNQTTGTWSLYQEGTYTPDAHSRWLGSICMDNNGSIALCYAKSSTSVYPSLCYTGRAASDPLGQMTVAETVAAAGTGSETSGNRYGDYSQTSLDPDGITFWHTGEYTLTSGTTTRVYSFQLPAPILNAPPVANFNASTTAPCIGSTVLFTDMSSNAPTGWAWTFSPTSVTYVGGTSASSQHPQVQFNAAGPYTVTLVATNPYGFDDEVKTNYITPLSGAALPLIENFEGATFPPVGWTVENADAPSIAWGTVGAKGLERRAAAGNTGSLNGCAGIEMFNYNTDTLQVDNLISSPLSLLGASAPKMTFKRAYKTYVSTTNPLNYRDELKVFISTDCGATWGSAVYFKKGAQLATNGTLNETFIPAAAADWDLDTVDLNAYVGQTIKVKFEFVNRYGNNLYVDDININNTATSVASVTIVSDDADNSICAGTAVTFTATPTNGGTTPAYQWQVNGVNAGTNSPTFTTSTLTNGQSVTCIMTSNLPGVTASPATSNAIATTVNATPTTPIVTTNSPVCAGSSINLSTATVSGGSYAWTGPNVFSNTTQNPSLSNATAAMAGTYNLIVTVNGCPSAAGSANVVVNPTVTPSISIAITSGSNPTCTGQALTFSATPTDGGTTPSYQWKVDGVNAGANAATFSSPTLTDNQVVTCVLTSSEACALPATATSNAITITVTPSVTPTISISTSSNPACLGTSVIFTAAITNGGTSPVYQWQVNGGNVGANASTYTSSTLTNGQIVTCVLTSNATCASSPTASSNAVTMAMNSIPATPIVSSNSPVCEGTTINLSTPTVAGANYAWSGPSYANSSQNPSIPSATVAMSGTYSLVVTENGCPSSPGTGTVTVNPTVTPSVSIAITTGGNPTCVSQSVTFTATPTAGGTAPNYQWQVNGVNAGTNAATFTPAAIADNDVISCTMSSNEPCATVSTATSNSITMSVTATVTPLVVIAADNNPACSGSTVTFTATPTNGGTTPAYQWQVNGTNVGPNSATFASATLVNGDIVTCIMTSSSGCAAPLTANSNAVTMTFTSSVTPTISIAVTGGTNPTCTGVPVTFTATPTNEGTAPTYQWLLNGSNAGTGGTTFSSSTLANGDVVSCELTSNAACISTATANSNPITIAITSGVTPSITITTSSTTICTGTMATFTSTISNGGTTPTYQWQVDGVNAGTNSASFSTSTLTNNSVVTCILTSDAGCLTTPTATSNALTMTVGGSVTPAISIAITSGSNPSCSGANLVFTATASNGGAAPAYQWQVNGVNAGTNSSTFTTNTLNNNDIVSCILTSNAACVSTPTATSNSITILISSSVTPTASIILSAGTNPSCAGSPLTFTVSSTNGGTTPLYQWMVNGGAVGTGGTTFTSSTLANNDVVTCMLTSNSPCASTATVTSNQISITITAGMTPSISITPSATSACNGTSISFTSIISNGGTAPNYIWNLNGGPVGSGPSYMSSTLNSLDVINCVLVSSAACLTTTTATSNNVSVNFSAPATPAVSTALTSGNNPSCQGSNVIFNATGSDGGTNPTYQWQVNGVNTGNNNPTFSTTFLNNNDIITCTMTSNAGCVTSSTASSTGITMTVNPIPTTPVVTVSAGGTTLTSSSPTGNQWYLNGSMLMGATGQTIIATTNGNYTVTTTNGTCTSDPSAVSTINSVAINEVTNVGTHFLIYPNPSNGKFTVVFTSTEIMKYKIELQNVLGQKVYVEELKDFNGTYTKDFDITDYGKGEYFLVITDSKKHKMEKLIIY
jgi:PKD repeat protein